MRKFLIIISLIFISSPLFSQSDNYKINDTRTRAFESMLRQLPELLQEKYRFPIPIIDDPRVLERLTVEERIPLEFFTNMTIIDSGLQVTYTYHEWDTLTQDWSIDPYERYQLTYDSIGNLTKYLIQNWDGADWVNSWQILYTYDSNGNLTEYFSQDWDGTDWVNDWRLLFTYDSNGNRTEYLFQNWDGTDWVNSSRSLYTYDSNGNRTEDLSQYWDGTDWVNGSRNLYTYDSNGILTEILGQYWDGADWVNSWQALYTYDSNGILTEYLGQTWDGTGWVNSWQVLYTYDSNGILTGYFSQDWDGTDWVNDWRILFAYDSNGNLTEYLVQNWDGTNWVNDYIVYVDYNNIVGVDESEIFPTEYSLKQNYPNPFNPTTTLEYTLLSPGEVSLIIYNLLGQEVARLVSEAQQAGYHKVTWDASNMTTGVYLYRLQSRDFVQTRKMLLLK